MRIIRHRDTRSYYQRFMDFVFGEKLTDEELGERKQRMIKAKCFLLGGGGATGKIEIISMKEERKKK